MPSGRPTPPLFELLRDEGSREGAERPRPPSVPATPLRKGPRGPSWFKGAPAEEPEPDDQAAPGDSVETPPASSGEVGTPPARPSGVVEAKSPPPAPGASPGGSATMPARPVHIPIRARPIEHEAGVTDGEEASPRVRRFGSLEIVGGRAEAPVAYLYLGLAGVLFLLLVVWVTGYGLGRHDEKSAYSARLSSSGAEAPSVTDPLNEPRSGSPLPSADAGRVTEPDPRPVTGTRPSPTTPEPRPSGPSAGPGAGSGSGATPATVPMSPTAVITAAGPVAGDPREDGLNYLVIASNVVQDEAVRLPAFLAEFGIPAASVPVLDRRGQAANDPPRYTVVVLAGVPGNQFSARAEERERLVQRIAQLGRVWSRERGGTVDFRDPLWQRYSR